VTPDTFRVAEALELGAIPVVDNASGQGLEDYWSALFYEPFFPTLNDWKDGRGIVKSILSGESEFSANSVFSEWQIYKRELFRSLLDDIGGLSLQFFSERGVTVLVPTSPIPSHPSTAIIEETLDSIRDQLPHAEVLVMIDGVRAEQADDKEDYNEYVNSLLHLCNEMPGITPFVFTDHAHQGVMTRIVLKYVSTDTILFVEHDTPLLDREIPWDDCIDAINKHGVNVLRFHHEAAVHPEHMHLMVGEIEQLGNLPAWRTVQWSQRPHLAQTNFYRWMIETYFGMQSRTMIEDVMYSVVESFHHDFGFEGWEKIGLWMYHPEGDLKRSTHTDGREGNPKFDMMFDYDSEVEPEMAPHRGVR